MTTSIPTARLEWARAIATIMLTTSVLAGCEVTTREPADADWRQFSIPTAEYEDMTLACSQEEHVFSSGGERRALAKIYVEIDGEKHFLPDLPESFAAQRMDRYGDAWPGEPIKRKYYKDESALQFDDAGRLVKIELRHDLAALKLSAKEGGPYLELSKENCPQFVAMFGKPHSWHEGNLSGNFPLKEGRLYDTDGVPSAKFATFDVDCDPQYGTISSWGPGGVDPDVGAGLPEVFVKFGEDGPFFLPELKEEFVAWRLDKRHERPSVGTTIETEYGDGQSMLIYRGGQLDSIHVTAGSNLMTVSAAKEGPYHTIGMTREQIIQVFGKPKGWWAVHPSGRF